ncbi:hypothetical protein EON66_04340 [archaeon]|nr:MAG: hypothetical protein EON66_04340 [archaeon]
MGAVRFDAVKYSHMHYVNGQVLDDSGQLITSLYSIPTSLPPPCFTAAGVKVSCADASASFEFSLVRAPLSSERVLADEDDFEKGFPKFVVPGI